MTEINVTNETNENKKLKKPTLFLILFLISNVIFPGWSFLLLLLPLVTLGVALPFGFIAFISTVFAIDFHDKYKNRGKCKKRFIVSTIISISCTVIVFASPFIGIKFEETKIMYPLKRAVYVMGVRSSANEILPKKLPQNINDYYFRTQLNFPVKDYSPYSYLSFYTDKDSIAKLEEKCKKKGGYTTEAEMTYSEYIADLEFTESELNDKELMLSYKCEYLESLKFPKHVFWQLSDKKQDKLDETLVVYNFDNSRHGYAFDYDSGLVVVWEGGMHFVH